MPGFTLLSASSKMSRGYGICSRFGRLQGLNLHNINKTHTGSSIWIIPQRYKSTSIEYKPITSVLVANRGK